MIRIREMNVSNRVGSRMLYTPPEARKINMNNCGGHASKRTCAMS